MVALSSLSALVSAFLLFTVAVGQVSLSIVDASMPLNEVDSTYIAYNIDTGSLYNGMDFGDTKFRTLVTNLGPSIIRIGGTAVDASYYFPETPYLVGQQNSCASCGSGASAIGNEMLTAIFDFIIATNFSLLWDLNGEKPRATPGGPWLPGVNATPMFDFIQSQYGGKIGSFAYSVGNEPEAWTPAVTPAQLGLDAVTLKNTLKSYDIGSAVYGSSFAEISVSEVTAFLGTCAGKIDGLTVHNYPYGGHNCNVTAYLQKGPVTSTLFDRLSYVKAVAAGIPAAASMLLVLEETAGSSGGGCENVTDRFVAGFSWLATLNAVASSGFSRVHRQDIAGWSFAFGQSHYMLAGPSGWTNGSADLLTPHPDYYTTILFRRMMGRRILNTIKHGRTGVE